jgi:hypothetical protein
MSLPTQNLVCLGGVKPVMQTDRILVGELDVAAVDEGSASHRSNQTLGLFNGFGMSVILATHLASNQLDGWSINRCVEDLRDARTDQCNLSDSGTDSTVGTTLIKRIGVDGTAKTTNRKFVFVIHCCYSVGHSLEKVKNYSRLKIKTISCKIDSLVGCRGSSLG